MPRGFNYRIRKSSYTAEPDWRGLDEMHREDAMRNMIAIQNAANMATYSTGQTDRLGRPLRLSSEEQQRIQYKNEAAIREIQVKAQFDAQNFETRYTAQQKLEIARIRYGQQQALSNPNFTEEEKQQITKAADLAVLGIKPQELPKLQSFPKGQGIGETWIDQATGALMARDSADHMWQPDWRKTALGHQQTVKDAMQQKVLEKALDWASNDTAVVTGHDDTGKPNSWRRYNKQEIAEMVKSVMDAMNPQSTGYESIRGRQLTNIQRKSNLQSMGEHERAIATQQIRQQQDSANAILQEAINNPEKMRDEDFARRARAAREFLRGNQ